MEATIENNVVRWAKSRGFLVRKMNGTGFRSWPDRMFLIAGRVAFIEFKRPGNKCTPQQEAQLEMLRSEGFDAEVFDSEIAARDWLVAKFDKWLRF